MHRIWSTLPALLAGVLAIAPAGAQAQAQDQDARSAIIALKTEIQRLRADLAALQARVDRQEQVVVQTPAGLQIGNPATRRLAIVSADGTVVFDRNMVVIDSRAVAINGARTIDMKSDAMTLDARVMTVKGENSPVIKGSKVLGN